MLLCVKDSVITSIGSSEGFKLYLFIGERMKQITKLFSFCAMIALFFSHSEAGASLRDLPSNQLNCYITGNSRATIRFTGSAVAHGTTYYTATLSESLTGRSRTDLNITISDDQFEIRDGFLASSNVDLPAFYTVVLWKNKMVSSDTMTAYSGFVSLQGTQQHIPRSNAVCVWQKN